jgi:hypothetical protein
MTRVSDFWHNPRLQMTKTELQSALAEATQTDKRTAGVFLDTLSDIATKKLQGCAGRKFFRGLQMERNPKSSRFLRNCLLSTKVR